MANKTELFIQKIVNEDKLQFQDTYLGASYLGTQLGLEFNYNVENVLSVGQIITIDKTNKSINAWVDGTASIIAITSSSIYPAPSSLIFTDRPLQTPIVFSSNENGFIFFDEVQTARWYEVELSDTVAFPITFNIADVRQINNRNGAYSKTLSIPGTKDNTKVFENIFDIQAIDSYNTRVKVKCSVVVDTVPVLEGYLQLDKIKCDDNNHWTYECVIFGENANFSKEIDQNAKLTDLDFSEFDHYKTIDAITQSWSGDYTDGYIYPYIDYNNGRNPIDILQDPLQGSVLNENFKPAIYVKQYWDKIFRLYGYTYESNFLNSPEFENLIIPTNVKTVKNQDLWRFNSSFKAGITDPQSFTSIGGTQLLTVQQQINGFVFQGQDISTSILNTWTMSTAAPFFYNPQFVFTDLGPSASFQYQNSFDGTTFKKQKIILNLDMKITPVSNTGFAGLGFILFCKFYKNGNYVGIRKVTGGGGSESTFGGGGALAFYNNQRQAAINTFGPLDEINAETFLRKTIQVVWNTETDGYLDNNDTLEVRLGICLFGSGIVSTPTESNYIITKYKLEFFNTTTGSDGSFFYNDIDTELLSNQPVGLNQTIPGNVKQIDFINSIIKMFNLYLSQDKVDPKKIVIEPRNDFYYTNQIINWSNKLDRSKEISQEPIVDRKKRVFMSYKEDKDLLNADYKSNFNEIYGQYEYITDNEFETSEQKVEIIFSPSPLSNRRLASGTLDIRLAYTQILDPKAVINVENYNKIESNIRILYTKKVTLTGSTFKVYDNVSYLTYNFYPYAGHLDDPTNPELDLCFQEPLETYYFLNNGYTGNNLYEVYYKLFFEELYGEESKTITAYFYLTPQDLLDFDYRKLIYVDNISSGSTGYFRVNKIEYDAFNKQSYKVELIKVLNNVDFVKPRINITPGVISDDVTKPITTGGVVSVGNYTDGLGNVIGGFDNVVKSNNNIVSGRDNVILNGSSNVITGVRNQTNSSSSGIISSRDSVILGSGRYSNIIGGVSQSISGRYSNIIGGYNNTISTYTSVNQILGGYKNTIGLNTGTTSVLETCNSFIIGGSYNIIEVGTSQSSTQNTFILGGQNNTIAAGVTNSFILNGNGVTLTQSNTVYIDGTLIVNGVPIIGGGSQGPTGPTGPAGTGGGGLFEENVLGNRHYIQLISATPSTEEYFLGFNTKPFSGVIVSTASTAPLFQPIIIDADNKNLISRNGFNVDIVGKNNGVDGARSTFISSKGSYITGTSEYGSIHSSYYGCIINSNKSSIISSNGYSPAYTSCIASSKYSNISTHSRGQIYSSCYASIIAGSKNEISNSDTSIILGAKGSTICLTYAGSIIGGVANLSKCGLFSTIIGGYTNCIYTSYSSSIIGGQFNKVYTNSNQSSIISGYQNTIDNSNKSTIISGQSNCICSSIGPNDVGSIISSIGSYLGNCSVVSAIIGASSATMSNSYNSVILGGQNLILNATNDTVLVPNFWIAGSLSPDNGVSNGLTQDVSVSGTTFSFCNGVLTAVIV